MNNATPIPTAVWRSTRRRIGRPRQGFTAAQRVIKPHPKQEAWDAVCPANKRRISE